jgi:hypothetical protein
MSMEQKVTDLAQQATDKQPADERRRRASSQPPTSATENGGHTGGSLTRVTANFTPRAIQSLDRISGETGDSRTDVLNMAVMAYETMLSLIKEGDGRTLRVSLPDGEIRVLQFIG